jgi:hypothetical protein
MHEYEQIERSYRSSQSIFKIFLTRNRMNKQMGREKFYCNYLSQCLSCLIGAAMGIWIVWSLRERGLNMPRDVCFI